MPVMDGYEATAEIRKLEQIHMIARESCAVIIGLTGHCADSFKNKCFDSGMNHYMVKPIDNLEL